MDFDSNALRVFCSVFEHKSFSLAARQLGVSQPSVSQMVSRLEAKLDNLLFERAGHAILPTRLAQDLHQFAAKWLEDLDGFDGRLQEAKAIPKGLVRLAKPESCLWTPYYQAILRMLGELTEVRIDIDIKTNDEILAGVAADRYDFGFIVGEKLSTELRFEKFSEEHYVAVQSRQLKQRPSFERGAELRLITYPGWETFFHLWAGHHGLSKRHLNVVSVVNVGNLAGAIEAVAQGAGAAVMPLQCVRKPLADKIVSNLDPGKTAAHSPVYLIRRGAYRLPARAEAVLEKLRAASKVSVRTP